MAANAQIIVAEDGSGDFRTISEAVVEASDGDRILVRPGTYRESVSIDKTVTLQGEGGRDAVILAFPPDSPGMELTDGREGDPEDPLVTFSVPTGIRLAADDIVLSDMTVTGAYPGIAIAVDAGTADLSDLSVALEAADADEDRDLASDTRIALIVAEGADADLRKSTLDADVTALEGGSVTVEQSVLTGGDISGDRINHIIFEIRGRIPFQPAIGLVARSESPAELIESDSFRQLPESGLKTSSVFDVTKLHQGSPF